MGGVEGKGRGAETKEDRETDNGVTLTARMQAGAKVCVCSWGGDEVEPSSSRTEGRFECNAQLHVHEWRSPGHKMIKMLRLLEIVADAMC